MSLPEVLLWRELRKRPAGLKFRRQHPIEPYVADFFCGEARLVIEVDGGAHDGAQRQSGDAKRDDRLGALGFDVLRIPAAEILRDVGATVGHIIAHTRRPLHQPAAGPPPRSGEDR